MIIHALFSLESLQIRFEQNKKERKTTERRIHFAEKKNRNVIFVFSILKHDNQSYAHISTDRRVFWLVECVAIFVAMRKCVSIEMRSAFM